MNKLLLTEKQNQYFIKIVKNHTTKEIQEKLYKNFEIRLSSKQIQYLKSKNHLKSGIQFMQKGRKPHNYKSIGSIYTREDGFTYIKIGEPRIWKAKHIYMWEKYNNKKVPKGYHVIFLNQNRTDFSKDNLKLVNHKDYMLMLSNRSFYKNKSLTKSGLLLIQLSNRIKELEDNFKNERL